MDDGQLPLMFRVSASDAVRELDQAELDYVSGGDNPAPGECTATTYHMTVPKPIPMPANANGSFPSEEGLDSEKCDSYFV